MNTSHRCVDCRAFPLVTVTQTATVNRRRCEWTICIPCLVRDSRSAK